MDFFFVRKHLPLEVVPAALADQARLDQFLVAELVRPQMLGEFASAHRGEADAEVLGGVPVEAALIQELASGQGIRGAQLPGEEVGL